jgi:hypothetical protein
MGVKPKSRCHSCGTTGNPGLHIIDRTIVAQGEKKLGLVEKKKIRRTATTRRDEDKSSMAFLEDLLRCLFVTGYLDEIRH